ncbi:HesA/MoeB/ThiF family protein [Mangrovimonas sp. ST2L15]|uniref:HesA/MoeB/ThiF family protein n=1 Tax=Mangrovimonas sp. ST2L15 TaxID=1645916 RepID=UPI0006B41DE6|nr:HesA/MoeB/ThiF family protein [Mangrovimonas sp. ST2L15]
MTNDERYTVQERLPEINKEGQLKINRAHVAIVGCGGLGCFAALSLTGLGIGRLTLIDGDTVELRNLQRQLLFKESDVGRFKSSVAKETLEHRNSTIKVIAHNNFLAPENLKNYFEGVDVIVDGTDNYSSRLLIDSYCSYHKIPLVFAGVKGFEGQVSVFNYKGGKSLKEVFRQTENIFRAENCSDSGVMPYVVAATANFQVNEVVKIILGSKEVLQGKLLYFDMMKLVFRTLLLK